MWWDHPAAGQDLAQVVEHDHAVAEQAPSLLGVRSHAAGGVTVRAVSGGHAGRWGHIAYLRIEHWSFGSRVPAGAADGDEGSCSAISTALIMLQCASSPRKYVQAGSGVARTPLRMPFCRRVEST